MTQLLFWSTAFIIFYTFFGYPILVSILARYAASPVNQADIFPTVTLLIAAYNEEDIITEKIENSLALAYPYAQFKIVIVADGSDDNTVEIVATYKNKDNRIYLYHQPERQTNYSGNRCPDDFG